jgi:hypothetical protein
VEEHTWLSPKGLLLLLLVHSACWVQLSAFCRLLSHLLQVHSEGPASQQPMLAGRGRNRQVACVSAASQQLYLEGQHLAQ